MPDEPPRAMQSRTWSCHSLLAGVAAVMHEADIDLPDDVQQLEDGFQGLCLESVFDS